MTRPLVWLSSRSRPNNRPRYSAAFTVRSAAYSEAAEMMVHSGSFHTIALYAPLFRLVRADPSKLTTNRHSSVPTVGGSIVTNCLGFFCGAIAINTSSTSSRGVMLAARAPSISSSPLVHLWTSSVQFDSNAAHLPSLPLRPDDWTSQAKVEYRVSTRISRDTSMV